MDKVFAGNPKRESYRIKNAIARLEYAIAHVAETDSYVFYDKRTLKDYHGFMYIDVPQARRLIAKHKARLAEIS